MIESPRSRITLVAIVSAVSRCAVGLLLIYVMAIRPDVPAGSLVNNPYRSAREDILQDFIKKLAYFLENLQVAPAAHKLKLGATQTRVRLRGLLKLVMSYTNWFYRCHIL